MEAKTCKHGLGLCLSGGGFRASFYHIGVLARMAELEMLRHVEVISTVSGGSIVGAAYYLKVKKLLEDKADDEIKGTDYVQLVSELEVHYLQAVQNNMRMRTFANPLKNMRMSRPNYSRSDAIGELYEKYIYKPLIDVGDQRIKMHDLLITPKGYQESSFHPCDEAHGNANRHNKVPILVLNATSLNSGHNWYFTARSMGEVPPRNLNVRDIDKKDRYRRVRYDEIESRKPYFHLGSAVAASAGVPGLFPPMAVSKLYKDRRVQLVDGGVFENQGISGLLDPDHICTDFVVSDASGQSDATDNPDTSLFKVLGYASSILMGRVREEMVNNLEETRTEHVAYFHLTRGLFARNIEFNEQPVKDEPALPMRDGIVSSAEEFNVVEHMQRAIAHIRTDLDSFSDVEARCLEADGYQMSESRLQKLPEDYIAKEPQSGEWEFTQYTSRLANDDPLLLKHLKVARRKFFKPLFLVLTGTAGFSKSLGLAVVSLPLIASLAAIFYLVDLGLEQIMPYSIWQILTDQNVFQQFMYDAAPYLYSLLVAFLLSRLANTFIEGSGKWTVRLRKVIKSPMSFVIGTMVRLVLPVVFAIPIIIYVLTIDKYFVRVLGKLR